MFKNLGPPLTSIDKFHQVIELADTYGVRTSPAHIGDMFILPIYAWYDFSFGEPCEFLEKVWMDFRRCYWPDLFNTHSDIHAHFLGMTPPVIEHDAKWVITFSHFLPRIDLMPKQIPADKRKIYPVLGSKNLDEKIRDAGAHIHIYGHSHVNRGVMKEGICYINNAFGYPNETHIARKRLIDVMETYHACQQ